MALELRELLDELVERIALCGTFGFNPAQLQQVVEGIYRIRNQNVDDGAEEDFTGTARSEPVPDIESILVPLRTQLLTHPDILACDSEDGDGPPTRRWFATSRRKWRTLAGHPQSSAIAPLEFDLLSVIGAHGPTGIIQGHASKLAKQDKRSVPGRTDTLAAKGYILKTAAIDRGHETSLLRLKKLVKAEQANDDDVARSDVVSRDQKGTITVDLGLLLAQTISLVQQQPDLIMAIQDLGPALGFRDDTIEHRRLLQCVRRLADSGCFRKCSALPADDRGAVLMNEVKCIQLVRKPTAEDTEKWLTASFVTGAKARRLAAEQDSGSDSEDEDAVDASLAHPARNLPLPTLIFGIIENSGEAGLSWSDLRSKIPRSISGRVLSDVMTELTSQARRAQAPHLRHLSIVVEEAKGGVFREERYRTLGNFIKLADPEIDALEGLHGREGAATSADAPSETDRWSFARPETSLFVDGPSTSPIAEPQRSHPLAAAKATADSGQQRRKPGPNKGHKEIRKSLATTAPATVALPKLRITSEKDQEQFELWAKATADRLARFESLASAPPVSEQAETEPASKRRRTLEPGESQADHLEHRIAELEAALLGRERSGVYINPPGAKAMKAQYTRHVGRPRNALIAVVKSERLKTLSWFRHAEARPSPLASRNSASQVTGQKQEEPLGSGCDEEQEGGESVVQLYGTAADTLDGAPDPTDPRTPPTTESGAQATTLDPKLAVEVAGILATESTMEVDGESRVREPNAGHTSLNAVDHILPALPSSAPKLDGPSHGDAPSVISGGMATPFATFSKQHVQEHKDEQFHHVGGGRYRRGPKPGKVSLSAIAAPQLVVNGTTERISERLVSDASDHIPFASPHVDVIEQRNVALTVPLVESSPITALQGVKQLPLVLTTADISGGAPGFESVQDVPPLHRHQARAQDPPVSLPGFTGVSTIHLPTTDSAAIKKGSTVDPSKPASLVLDIMRQCDGVFSGNREIWFPYATAYEKLNHQVAKRMSVNRAVKDLLSSNKMKKITFTFQSRLGTNETRSIVVLPDVDPSSERVLGLKNAIILNFPSPCIPSEVEISETLRVEHHIISVTLAPLPERATPRKHTKRWPKFGRIYEDEFPAIEGLTVQRAPQDEDVPREKEPWGKSKTKSKHKSANAEDLTPIEVHETTTASPESPRVKRKRRDTTTDRSSNEWHHMSPGQTFYPISGTFGTTGIEPSQPSLPQRATSSPSEANTLHDVQHASIAQDVTYDRTYVHAHPSECFRHTGHGRYRHGEAAPPTQPKPAQHEELYEKAYVQAHPDQTFYHAGNGRYRRRDEPQISSFTADPPSTPFPSSSSVNSTGPSRAPNPSLVDLLKTSQSAQGPSISAPSTTHEKHLEWLQAASARHASMLVGVMRSQNLPATTGNQSTPVVAESPAVQTPKAGRPLHKSRKRKASVVDDQHGGAQVHIDDFEKSQARSMKKSRKARSYDADEITFEVDGVEHAPPIAPMRASSLEPADFAHSDELIVVLALCKTLCSGLRQAEINWEVVAHAMGFRYEPADLKRVWMGTRRSAFGDVQRLITAMREPFLLAYAQDELPRVDYKDLSATDWPALLSWAQTVVVPKMDGWNGTQIGPRDEVDANVDLPGTSTAFHGRYVVIKPDSLHGPDPNRFFDTMTDGVRINTALQLIHGRSAPTSQAEGSLMILKSWCRAVAATPDHAYHAKAASHKISIFPDRLLKRATEKLVKAEVLVAERRGRQLPGRNYSFTKTFTRQFQRWPTEDATWLREVAAARHNVMASFSEHPQLQLSYHTNNFETVVLTNMVAQGHLKITTELPPRNDAIDAPFPRLSIWGIDEAETLYNSHGTNRERLWFPVMYEKTPAFQPDHGLKHVPMPLLPRIFDDEPGLRLPLWVDIHGSPIDHLWDMAVRSILHLIVYRPGITAQAIEKAHEGMLWAWEAEVLLQWMEETGLALSFGPGEEGGDGRWKGGWRASEWWYCAFLPEIATWTAPRAWAE
ncbi:hypothetical protein LTR53_011178 [Teratosphaeriaceae sp. CCFEE 6253]|nr:hypothetical protein LTR53_011178 [Teratosphaeriaceae sp. CCFEE 6253]